jgi:hypothetical protein
MSAAAQELLVRLAKLGASVRPAGDQLLLRAGTKSIPGDLVKRLRESKADLVRVLERADRDAGPNHAPAWWHRHYTIRAIHWGISGVRPERQARALAWAELLNEWHYRHGQRWLQSQCAGCGAPIGGLESLELGDGNRIHLNHLDCLLSFGKRWRSEAAAGLRGFGLDPPLGFAL